MWYQSLLIKVGPLGAVAIVVLGACAVFLIAKWCISLARYEEKVKGKGKVYDPVYDKSGKHTGWKSY